jgi:hypothetical protein
LDEDTMPKRWTEGEIYQRLASGDPDWLTQAVLAICRRHIADEHKGFAPDDAATGTRLGRLLARGLPLTDLPPYHDWARRAILRYTEQLTRIANREG